jgi:hypothetical protein
VRTASCLSRGRSDPNGTLSLYRLILSKCTSITHSVSDHKLTCITCPIASAHAFSRGSQVLYGSLVLLSLSMLSALGHKSSMGRLFGCICPCFQHWITSPLWVACSLIKSHTSPLWVTCFGVGRLFSSRCGRACVCMCVCVRVCEYMCACMGVCVYRKFVQGDYSPCDLALVERSKCFESSLECR